MNANPAVPYYLLFGKQTDASGVYTRFWVEVKLPNKGKFACIDLLSPKLRGDVGVKVAHTANTFKEAIQNAPASYRYAEKAAMDTLNALVRRFVECCDLQMRGSSSCDRCILNQMEIYESLTLEGFRKINVGLPFGTVPPASTSVSIEDFAASDINLLNQMQKELGLIAGRNHNIGGYITKDANFCDGKYDLAKQRFANSPNTFKVWWHLWKDPATGQEVLLEKINTFKEYLEVKYPSPPDCFDATASEPCHATARAGRSGIPDFFGTIEHWCIELDYTQNINPLAFAEYYIPDSGNGGGPGYVDLADVHTGELYEIKSRPQLAQGQTEVARYRAFARRRCPNTANWVLGTTYPGIEAIPRTISYPIPNKELLAWQGAPGVILYVVSTKPPSQQPAPVALPTSTTHRINQFLQRIKTLDNVNIDDQIRIFFEENPDIVETLKTTFLVAGVVIAVGTLIEDIVTLGAGIADDWASFYVSYRLIAIALK